jgi:hypothetical protein
MVVLLGLGLASRVVRDVSHSSHGCGVELCGVCATLVRPWVGIAMLFSFCVALGCGCVVSLQAFPSNTFNQETGTAAEIKEFVRNKGSTFPLFAKVDVNGPTGHPLFLWLQTETPGFMTDAIKVCQ